MTDISLPLADALNALQGFEAQLPPETRADFARALGDLEVAAKAEIDALIVNEARARAPVIGPVVGKIMADAANKALDDLITEATAAKAATTPTGASQ